MSPLAQLLGSQTRASIIEILARTKKPISAYRISKIYNLNISKVYIETKRMKDIGVLSSRKGKRGLEFALTDSDLRALAPRLSPRTITYDDWRSSRARAQRLRDGLVKIPKFKLGRPSKKLLLEKPTRSRGELDVLAGPAKRQVSRKYRKVGDREYVRVS